MAGQLGQRTPHVGVELLESRRLLTSYSVTSVADSGTGTLRQALLDANANPGPDSIVVNLPSSISYKEVYLTSPLPAITDALSLQVQNSGGMAIRGFGVFTSDGLTLSASNVSINGLTVYGFRNGVVSAGNNNALINCKVYYNQECGVRTTGGSLSLINCNVYRNDVMNIDMGSDGPTANDVADLDGVANYPLLTSSFSYTAPLLNSRRRAVVYGSFHGLANTQVQVQVYLEAGSPTPDSSDLGFSVQVTTDGNGDATFYGQVNRVDATSDKRLLATATYNGRTSEFSPVMAISTAPADNVVTSPDDSGPATLRQLMINANARPGRDLILFDVNRDIQLASPLPDVTDSVILDASFSARAQLGMVVRIVGPTSGAPADGLHLLASGSEMRFLGFTGFRHGVLIESAGNVIGTDSAPVMVFHNSGDGVRVLSGTGNRIGAQSLYNGGLPIDLGGDGATPNDALDADSGINLLQNSPVVGAIRNGTSIDLSVSLQSAASAAYQLDFYAFRRVEAYNERFDPVFFLGSAIGTTGSDGQLSMNLSFAGSNLTRVYSIAATATDASGNTSEQSAAAQVGYAPRVVTSAADSGPGTLRETIDEINNSASPGTIRFAIPGTGTHRITLSLALPQILQPMVIDAASQPGYSGSPVIELIGQTNLSGLDFAKQAVGSCVIGLAVGGFETGVRLRGEDSEVRSSYLGLDSGARAVPNGTGLLLNGGGVVGGLAAGDGNVISANLTRGVHVERVSGEYFAPVRFQGNFIGTDPSGTRAMGQPLGIDVAGTEAFIGGSVAAARNIISGNSTVGVRAGNYSGSVEVAGNFIGTDISGEKAIPNGVGVEINVGGTVGTIGGTLAAARNVIAGNTSHGILFSDYAAVPSILGNSIGLTASNKPLGNGGDGVRWSGYYGRIGGTNGGEANLIAFNGGNGVTVGPGMTPSEVPIRANLIYANGMLPIDLGGNGPTANDPSDVDGGPNSLHNFPILSGAYSDGVRSWMSGTINTNATESIILDFYATAPGKDAQTYLGSTVVVSDTSGNAAFNVSFSTPVAPGSEVVATATGDSLRTSEVSGGFVIAMAGDANRDRIVDFFDLTALSANYGRSGAAWADGDFNGDGIVNFFDLTTLAANYGAALPAAPVTPLPAMAGSDQTPTGDAGVVTALVTEPSAALGKTDAPVTIGESKAQYTAVSVGAQWAPSAPTKSSAPRLSDQPVRGAPVKLIADRRRNKSDKAIFALAPTITPAVKPKTTPRKMGRLSARFAR